MGDEKALFTAGADMIDEADHFGGNHEEAFPGRSHIRGGCDEFNRIGHGGKRRTLKGGGEQRLRGGPGGIEIISRQGGLHREVGWNQGVDIRGLEFLGMGESTDGKRSEANRGNE